MGMETLKVLTHTRPKPATHDRDVAARHVTAGAESIYISQVTCSLRPEQKVV